MTTLTLHPALDPVDGITMLTGVADTDRTVIEVTGITQLADIRTIQSWADAARITVRWELHRHGDAARLHRVALPPAGARTPPGDSG